MQKTSEYHQTDKDLLHEQKQIEAAKENPEKFEVLYNKYHEQIFRFIYQRIDSVDQAHDITSKVFLNALSNLYRFQFKGVPFSSWLYRIAVSELNNAYKQNKTNRAINVESVGVESIMEEVDESNQEEFLKKLIKALKQLNEEQLQFIEMRFFEQRAFKEIAQILDITENNAKVKLYRALAKLKKIANS